MSAWRDQSCGGVSKEYGEGSVGITHARSATSQRAIVSDADGHRQLESRECATGGRLQAVGRCCSTALSRDRRAVVVYPVRSPSTMAPSSPRKSLDEWAYRNGVLLDFTRPGNPDLTIGLCESFNGRLRDECLNVTEFMSIEHAKAQIEAWRIDYNEHRPHGALGHLTPSEYAKRGQLIALGAAHSSCKRYR